MDTPRITRDANHNRIRAFTLVELSIVLVIIGLIAGGILVGRDLISAAAVRAQITQIEKINTATNTFYSKYGFLPGDIPAIPAAQFGFTPRGQYAGQGDGNGILEGVSGNGPSLNYSLIELAGETVMFWVDLTTANGQNLNMIPGAFSAASATTLPSSSIVGSAVGNYLPNAQIGQGNYIYAWSFNGINLFGISAVTSIPITNVTLSSNPGLSVKQAYSIDMKIDDGFPQAGTVQTFYISSSGGTNAGVNPGTAATASSTTCYDNGGNASNTMVYSLGQNNGSGINCALNFKFR